MKIFLQGKQFQPPQQNEYEDVENPTPWKPRFDRVGRAAGTRQNGALAEAQPGISERPPRNRSLC